MVHGGERPAVPDADAEAAPEGFMALMHELWAQDPVARPTFTEALERLRAMRGRSGGERKQRCELDLVSDLFDEQRGHQKMPSSSLTVTDYALEHGHGWAPGPSDVE